MLATDSGVTWLDDVRHVLDQLGGKASLHEIYKLIEEVRKEADRSIPPSFEAIVRRTLEENSTDTKSYKGGPDFFCVPEGLGSGVWALRP